MALLSSSKCALIMSDEGLQVHAAGANSSRFIDFIPWETDGFVEVVSRLIIKKAKKKPVIVLNDMVEQHYRKEQVPKVNLLDRGNVLERRLNIAFPNHKIHAALKLKNASGIEDAQKGLPYLFAAMPSSNMFRSTMDAIQKSGAPLDGVYLLPVEASSMVRNLSVQLNKKDREKAMWTIFAGQHHNGGLRQVVIRNGELALTRMTPIVDTDVEPDLWAKELSTELSATMSYLSRFGYKETDGLRIIIISDEKAFDALTQLNQEKGKLNIMTAAQASKMLGMRLNKMAEQRYADPIYVSYLSKAKKFLLPMNSHLISRLTMPRKITGGIIAGLLLVTVFYGYKSFSSFAEQSKQQDQLQIAIQKRNALQEEYDREIAIKKELGFDFALVNSALDLFDELQKRKIEPLPLFREIGRSLGADLRLDNILVAVDEQKPIEGDQYRFDSDGDSEGQSNYTLNAVLNLSFPNSIDPDLGVRVIDSLASRLQQNLPSGYSVDITRQVADLSYTGNFVGGEDRGQQNEDYFAEIQIQGPVQ